MVARRVVSAALVLVAVLGAVEGGARVAGRVIVARHRAAAGDDGAATILCVGDSWTYGHGVAPADAWPARLGAAIRAAGGGDERVRNLGKPGGSAMVAARELAAAFAAGARPERVLVLVGMNPDPPGGGSADPGALRALRPWLSGFASYRLLTQAVWRARLAAPDAVGEVTIVPGLVESKEAGARFAREQARALQRGLARLDEIAGAHGAEVVVLNYALPPVLLDDPAFHGGTVNTRLAEAADALRLPLVDVQAAYVARGVKGPEVTIHGAAGLVPRVVGGASALAGDPRAAGYELHPNAAGHAIYAETVAAWLVAH